MADRKKDEQGFAQLSVFRSFVGVLDALDAAPQEIPPETESEQKLHDSYQALRADMLNTFTKLGLEEFHAAEGDLFQPSIHSQVPPCPAYPPHRASSASLAMRLALNLQLPRPGYQVEEVVVEENAAVGTVVQQVFPGLRTKTGTVRQAKVRVGVAAKPAEQEVQTQDRAAVGSAEDEDGAL